MRPTKRTAGSISGRPRPKQRALQAHARRAQGAQRRNRTADTGIFSPLLYRLSYLGAGRRGTGVLLRRPGAVKRAAAAAGEGRRPAVSAPQRGDAAPSRPEPASRSEAMADCAATASAAADRDRERDCRPRPRGASPPARAGDRRTGAEPAGAEPAGRHRSRAPTTTGRAALPRRARRSSAPGQSTAIDLPCCAGSPTAEATDASARARPRSATTPDTAHPSRDCSQILER